MKRMLAGAVCAAMSCVAIEAMANNVGENHAWQFETTTDKVNKAAITDMIEKKKSDYYAAPIYNTNIERQYNCSVASTAKRPRISTRSSFQRCGNSTQR